MIKATILALTILTLSACGKPQQVNFTNVESHAAVTGLCTAGAILVLRKLDVPTPWNEIGGAVACAAAVSIYKEGRDPIWDWGDVAANGGGASVVAGTFLFWEW